MYLQYYRGEPNFGDELSPVIVNWMLEQNESSEVLEQELSPEGTNLSAVGSVMHHLSSGFEVWGSGVMQESQTPVSGLKFHAVRGPRTRRYLLDNGYTEAEVPEVYGDPALLLPEFYTPKVLPWMSDMWVVIPHHKSVREMRLNMNQEDLDDLAMFGFHVVYPDEGWETVVDAIANARGVISQSLHGLIVADAYGVPNVWWNTGVLSHHDSHFKFLDYFESQGEAMRTSVRQIGEINEENWRYLMRANQDPRTRNQVDLEALKAAFPTESLSR